MNHQGWLRVLLVVPVYVLFIGLLQFLSAITFQFPLNLTQQLSSLDECLLMVFSLLGTLVLVALFTRLVDREPLRVLGLYTAGRTVEFFYSVGLIIFGFLLCYLSLEFNGQLIYQGANWNGREMLLSIGIYLAIAVSEEVLLRGYVLRNLLLSFQLPVALSISALLFSAMHLFNAHVSVLGLFNLFLAGIALGIAYLIRRSLWLPITIHFCWNFIQTHLGFPVSGNNAYSLIDIYMPEKNILNGGDFGIEGSLLAIVFQLVGIYVLYLWYRNNNPKPLLPH